MKRDNIVITILIIIVLHSCNINVEQESAINNIKNLESKLYSDSSKSVKPSTANELILDYAKFAYKYPKDTNSAEFLFRAAELSRALSMGHQSILYYDKITYTFPKYRKVAYCFFLEGFVYENIMNDILNAKKYYKLFITKYPTHPLAKDAKILIENLGKSPEELIKSFEKKETN